MFRLIQFTTGLLLIFAATGLLVTFANGDDSWNGKVKDESLNKIGESGFVADEESWETLWVSWRPDEDVPVIDFSKELVLIGTVSGPNSVLLSPKMNDGDVKLIVAGTKKAGPGFGYKLMTFNRKDVKTVNGKSIERAGVQGVLVISENLASFKGHQLEIKLWQYDPFLADVSADLVDELQVKEYSHEKGKLTETIFAVGAELKPRKDRSYYITVFVLQDGKRTHIGELNGKSGICKVFTDGKPTTVKMILRPVR